MYELNSLLIAGLLLVAMVVALEAGYRIGLCRDRSASAATRDHIGAIQA